MSLGIPDADDMWVEFPKVVEALILCGHSRQKLNQILCAQQKPSLASKAQIDKFFRITVCGMQLILVFMECKLIENG